MRLFTAIIALLWATCVYAQSPTQVLWGNQAGSPPSIVFKSGNSWIPIGTYNGGVFSPTLPTLAANTIACNPTGATATAVSCSSLPSTFTGTSGHFLPYLDGANTWNALQSFSTVDGARAISSIAPGVSGNPTYLAAATLFGGRQLVASTARDNAIVGAAIQDGSNGYSFPTGVTGYGYLGDAGNTSFGFFSRCDQHTTGVCTSEINTFNYAGLTNGTFPPNLAFGISTIEPNTLQIVSYGPYQSKIGTYYTSGVDGGQYGYIAGIYMNPLTASNYGIFVDADATHSPIQSALIKNTGQSSNVHLALQTTGTAVPGNYVITHLNSLGVNTFALTQGGAGIFTDTTLAPQFRAIAAQFPSFLWYASGNAVDTKTYDSIVFTDGVLHFRVISDDTLTANDWMTVSRSTTTPTGVGIIPALTLSAAPIMSTLTGFVYCNGATACTASTTPALGDASATSLALGTAGTAPAAGKLGEEIESSVPIGSAVAFTSTVTGNVTSVALTAGNWLCYGNVITAPAAGTTSTHLSTAITDVSATMPTAPNDGSYFDHTFALGAGVTTAETSGQRIFRSASPITVYLVANVTFASSTMGLYGYLGCLRQP